MFLIFGIIVLLVGAVSFLAAIIFWLNSEETASRARAEPNPSFQLAFLAETEAASQLGKIFLGIGLVVVALGVWFISMRQ